MRIMPHAALPPHRCAVIPFVGNHNSRGFFDTGMELPGWDPHVYVSVEAVEEMARMLGWAPQHVNQTALVKQKRAEEELKEKNAEIVALKEQLEAVQTLQRAGFTSAASRRPSRKVAA